MRLRFLGAAHTVTGSCYMLEVQDSKILIDCGMFQGAKRIREMNREDFAFVPAEVDAVLLTHAHIDHCGLIPKLCREGFKGPVYATKTTCELAQIMLPDSAHIQEADTEMRNRKGSRSGAEPVEPLYTVEDASKALQHFKHISYKEEFAVTDHIHAVYRDAGHIIGSAIIELYVTEDGKTTKLVFSGDLGQPSQPIINDPSIIHGADFLIVESTYGDRIHQVYDKEAALAEIVNDTMDRGGNLIIPAFAVGRTQTLLYYFYKLWKAGRIDDVPIILDSPLAIAATRIFVQNSQDFDDEAVALLNRDGALPQMPQLRICRTAAESQALNSSESSAIILSASGMADAGRILHHLKHNLWRPESTVLFAGYQAEGSLGRRLVDGMKRVRVMGEEIVVRATIKVLDGFSAHADADQLMHWIGCLEEPKPAKVFIVHGEATAQETMKTRIASELGLESYIPFRGDVANIVGRSCEIEASKIPSVSVEMEMEDYLRSLDAEYRLARRKLLQLVVHRPTLMPFVIKTVEKGWKYMRKLFAPYNI